ncbi:MAG: acyl-CoA thioesterase [Candidatus Omnitrophica bacterium]|nr:acyl-CoA thioesterase [Candidatus Omnitrophota bacterium]
MKHFDYEFRVRYGDTDKMGISYYANYFVWFEAARTEYFRALGLPYTVCEEKGYFLPVVETSAKYLAPSTYDDLLIVRTSVAELRQSSMRFEYQVFKKEDQSKAYPILCTGFSVHVFVDRNMRPCRMPEEIRGIVTEHRLL